MFEDVLFTDRKVSLNTMKDFEDFKKKAAENPMPNPVYVGTLNADKMQEVYKETLSYSAPRKQQVPAPMKMRLKLFLRRLRDMFVFTHKTELIDTYGMPGFQSPKKLIQTF